MSISRREFLRSGTGAVVAGTVAPGLMADAARPRAGQSAADRALVVIELSGGNDALNTVIPLRDRAYAQARPTLAIKPAQALELDRNAGLHPALGAMHQLFRQGQLAIVQGVGYPSPSRSHFRSSEIWHRGDLSTQSAGWLGRYVQHANSRSIETIAPTLHFGHGMPELFKAAEYASIGLHSGEELHPLLPRPEGVAVNSLTMSASVAPANAPGSGQVERIQSMLARPRQTKAVYPMGRMGTALSTFAQAIIQNAGPRLFYVSQGGYDTHARQAQAHGALLSEWSASVGALLADLQAEGRGRDVLVMVFSEFGRRPRENSSAGTDHGSAGVMFFAGGAVRGGLYGRSPSLSDLHEGDLRYAVDFRDCYATVLERWLDVPAEAVIQSRGRVDFL